MRVYLAPCGIGLGHVTRTEPIARELKKRGIETVLSTYLDGLEYSASHDLPSYGAVPINFKVTSDGTIDFRRTAATSGFSLGVRMFLRQVVKEIQFMKTFKPDVVFSDSRASSLLAARMLRIPVVLMLNQFRVEIIRRPANRSMSLHDRLFFFIANIGWMFIRTAIELVWVRSNIILIPDLPSPYTISLSNLTIPRRYARKIRLIGPILNHENDNGSVDDPKDIRAKLGLDLHRNFVYCAVSGPKVERRILSQLLTDSARPLNHRLQIAISRGEPAGSKNTTIQDGVIVCDWIEDQNQFILASDIVVSRAGHGTIMKSLAYGKPMILIPIPDHTEQYGNARRAVQLHVAKIIDQSRLDSTTLESAINSILSDHTYEQNSVEIEQTARSSEAVGAACDVIVSLAQDS